jgi:RNA polymerase sigma-70 factor (ECF subfamily)
MTAAGRPGGTGATDAALIAAIKAGDLSAFNSLVVRHEKALVNFFYHFSWDRQAAEDCAQEVFLKLYNHLGTYEPQAKFTTFLYRVAKNLWIDKLRSAAASPKPVSLEAPAGADDGRTLKDRVPARSETPIEILTKRETEEALRRSIDALPEEQRLVVVFSEMQGLKYQEISEILEIPVGTVKSRMHAAVERLRDLMAEME